MALWVGKQGIMGIVRCGDESDEQTARECELTCSFWIMYWDLCSMARNVLPWFY